MTFYALGPNITYIFQQESSVDQYSSLPSTTRSAIICKGGVAPFVLNRIRMNFWLEIVTLLYKFWMTVFNVGVMSMTTLCFTI